MSSSVVVVSYRAHEWLRPCIESVLDQADEVVVVDNGSGGAVAAVARQAGARVVHRAENLGFAGGVNAGLESVGTDVVALLNDDAVAGDTWLAGATEVLADATVAAVCPKILYYWPYAEIVLDDPPFFAPGDARPLGRQLRQVTCGGVDVLAELTGAGVHRLEEQAGTGERWRWTTGREPFYLRLTSGRDPATIEIDGQPAPVQRVVPVINSAGSFLTDDGYGGDVGSGEADDGQFDQAADRFGASGAALAFRRDTFTRVGPMAAHFFMYYEDVDWCWRAQLAGFRVRYDPASTVRHVEGGTSGGLASMTVRNSSARNRLACLVRNAPLGKAWREVRAEVFGTPPVGLRRGPLAWWLPRAAAERQLLRRSWTRSPDDVWREWAGRNTRRQPTPSP